MKIESKFNNNQQVYVIVSRHRSTRVPCKICKGTKKVRISGEEFLCPKCKGSGRRLWTHPTSVAKKYTIQGTRLLNLGTIENLLLRKPDLWVSEFEIYETKQECITACGIRNREVMKKIK